MLLSLDFSNDIPIYMQIRNQIVLGIADGRLSPGEKLPTIRALANETGINMMTVNKAYMLLKQEGFINSDRRSGVSVAAQSGRGTEADANESELPDKLVTKLRLIISELKLAGVTENGLLTVCGRLYREMEGK
jgi:DNA-binding transcriptional regulator YhcF (GntR family)